MPVSNVYNMDCMEGLRETPDKFYELAICDPPYGINAPNMQMGHGAKSQGSRPSTAVILKQNRLQRLNGGGGKLKNRILNTSKIGWDYEKPSPEYFLELERVSQNRIIWGGNYFNLPPTRCVICWDKVQPWDNFSQWEMAWTSFDSPASLFRRGVTGGANAESKIHPTQKPVALYSWLLKNYAKPGDKILDTHLGSGSHRIAAYKMGFDFTGYELDSDYFDDQEKRFKEAINEPLFNQQTAEQGKLL